VSAVVLAFRERPPPTPAPSHPDRPAVVLPFRTPRSRLPAAPPACDGPSIFTVFFLKSR